MALLLKGGHLVDPQTKTDGVADILIRDGEVVEVGTEVKEPVKCTTLDCTGRYVLPGLVDVHVHFRDPGQEYKETILTGMRAAAAGGFCGVVPMANTRPVCDTGSGIRYVVEQAAYQPGRTKVYPLGACTKGLEGKELAEMGDMVAAGAMAFSDDGRGIQDGGMMRRVLDYAKMFDVPVMSHCQDEGIVGSGVVNEGLASTRLGMAGWPAQGEEVQIARDISLAELTGCHLHIQHVTTAAGVELIAEAKKRGVPVTCEVTPHHLFLTEDDIDVKTYDTNLKMNPPLRTAEDAAALREALVDGTVDVVASDHAPHATHEKALEFEVAPFGTIGLETTLALLITNLVQSGEMSWQRLVEACAVAPRELLHIDPVSFKKGSVADITVVDPEATWTVGSDGFVSKANNSAFIGDKLTGRATDVFTDGYATLENGKVTF